MKVSTVCFLGDGSTWGNFFLERQHVETTCGIQFLPLRTSEKTLLAPKKGNDEWMCILYYIRNKCIYFTHIYIYIYCIYIH